MRTTRSLAKHCARFPLAVLLIFETAEGERLPACQNLR
jgi:hypothetical protein